MAYVTAIVGGAMLNISVPLFFVRNFSPLLCFDVFYPFHRSTFNTIISVLNIVYFFGEIIFQELIMESIYGWADEVTGSMLTVFINTIVQIILMVILATLPVDVSLVWTSWVLAGSVLVAFIFMFFLRVDYRRLCVDLNQDVSDTGIYFDRVIGCY